MSFGEKWNWQLDDWPDFSYGPVKLDELEAAFLRESGVFAGSVRHLIPREKEELVVGLMSDEALFSSEIEGEVLNRESLQSSIRRHLGLMTDHRRIPPAEQGISEMMVDQFCTFGEPLSEKVLFGWHEMLMNGRRDLRDVGCYRTEEGPMQIVSGSQVEPRVHFEAPPSDKLGKEMRRFVKWFNETAPGGKRPLPTLTRAGLAHWYFVSIHPFEDGNGRVARALAEKVLSQGAGQPSLVVLSKTINARLKLYYDALEYGNRSNEVSPWLLYFAQTVLEAQSSAQQMVDFLIAKTKYSDRFKELLNERQEKVLLRMFREGLGGFKGGLSAANYASIAGASRATVTRDLQDLVDRGALIRTGELKSSRYHLPLPKPDSGIFSK